MATLSEQRSITGTAAGDDLRRKLEPAICIKAQAMLSGTPTPNQLAWALDALAAPERKAQQMLNFVIAANNTATLSQITNVSDANIQAAVDAAADLLAQ